MTVICYCSPRESCLVGYSLIHTNSKNLSVSYFKFIMFYFLLFDMIYVFLLLHLIYISFSSYHLVSLKPIVLKMPYFLNVRRMFLPCRYCKRRSCNIKLWLETVPEITLKNIPDVQCLGLTDKTWLAFVSLRFAIYCYENDLMATNLRDGSVNDRRGELNCFIRGYCRGSIYVRSGSR